MVTRDLEDSAEMTVAWSRARCGSFAFQRQFAILHIFLGVVLIPVKTSDDGHVKTSWGVRSGSKVSKNLVALLQSFFGKHKLFWKMDGVPNSLFFAEMQVTRRHVLLMLNHDVIL